jgi:hypothetical protein
MPSRTRSAIGVRQRRRIPRVVLPLPGAARSRPGGRTPHARSRRPDVAVARGCPPGGARLGTPNATSLDFRVPGTGLARGSPMTHDRRDRGAAAPRLPPPEQRGVRPGSWPRSPRCGCASTRSIPDMSRSRERNPAAQAAARGTERTSQDAEPIRRANRSDGPARIASSGRPWSADTCGRAGSGSGCSPVRPTPRGDTLVSATSDATRHRVRFRAGSICSSRLGNRRGWR